MRWPLIVAAGLLAYAGWEWSKMQAEQASNEGDGWLEQTWNDANETLTDWGNMLTGYSFDKVPTMYRAAIAKAEQENGLPAQMLARLLWQECRYRPAIIDGRVRSPAGALGIAQFMPATAREMGIDPLNPFEAIPAAARYLAGLYRATGKDWRKALAAYNWGIGNVQRKGLAAAPLETRLYYGQILADLGMTTYA